MRTKGKINVQKITKYDLLIMSIDFENRKLQNLQMAESNQTEKNQDV